MCEQVCFEEVDVESSNIIPNDFVDHKLAENETLDATAKKESKSSTQSCSKFRNGMKLLEMYTKNKLKLQILQLNFVFNIFDSIFCIQMQNQPGGSTRVYFVLFYYKLRDIAP